jgi:hypothetical protein
MNLEGVLRARLKTVRLACDDRWLVWNDGAGRWIVYRRKLYAKKTRVLVETESLAEAMQVLTDDWDED